MCFETDEIQSACQYRIKTKNLAQYSFLGSGNQSRKKFILKRETESYSHTTRAHVISTRNRFVS